MERQLSFSSSVFEGLLAEPSLIGVEFRDVRNHSLRATVRVGSISLGVRLNYKGQRYYKKLASYPDDSLSVFRKRASKHISEVTLDPTMLEKATLNDVFEMHWIPFAKKRQSSYKTSLGRWEKHVANSKLAKTPLSAVKPIDIEHKLQELDDIGLKPATQNKVLSLISVVFKLAIKAQLCTVNPCQSVEQRPENNVIKTVFSQDGVKLFIQCALADSGYYPSRALILALYVGARIDNICTIKKSHISEDFSQIELPRTKNGTIHTLYLHDKAQTLVKELYNSSSSEFLLPSPKSKKGHISHPQAAFQRILQVMQSNGYIFDEGGTYTIHMLRCTYIVLAQQKLKDVYAVSKLASHSSIQSTQRYLSIYDEEMKSNAQSLNKMF